MSEDLQIEKREVSPEKSNPVCQEIANALSALEIPIGLELQDLLKQPNDDYRYGSPYALVSGKIIRALAEHGPRNWDAYDTLFGISSERAWEDIKDFID